MFMISFLRRQRKISIFFSFLLCNSIALFIIKHGHGKRWAVTLNFTNAYKLVVALPVGSAHTFKIQFIILIFIEALISRDPIPNVIVVDSYVITVGSIEKGCT